MVTLKLWGAGRKMSKIRWVTKKQRKEKSNVGEHETWVILGLGPHWFSVFYQCCFPLHYLCSYVS